MDFEEAKLNPSAVFDRPADVVAEAGLSREQKLAVLRQWEYDAREMEVAEEENMRGGANRVKLADVLAALDEVDPNRGGGDASPTKQGGE
ncbi:MAG: hypothetical protein WDZ30_05365 [Cellvibrionaceae bacterium]